MLNSGEKRESTSVNLNRSQEEDDRSQVNKGNAGGTQGRM